MFTLLQSGTQSVCTTTDKALLLGNNPQWSFQNSFHGKGVGGGRGGRSGLYKWTRHQKAAFLLTSVLSFLYFRFYTSVSALQRSPHALTTVKNSLTTLDYKFEFTSE